jgi:hypothetical protein
MCNVQALITNGILRMGEDAEVSEESLTFEYALSLRCPLMLIYSFTMQVQERISGLSEAVGDGPAPRGSPRGLFKRRVYGHGRSSTSVAI